MRKKNVMLLVVAGLLAVCVAGCGTKPAPNTVSDDTPDTVTTTVDDNSTEDSSEENDFADCNATVIASGRTTIYAEPDKTSDIIGSYDSDTEIKPTMFNQSTDWYMVDFNGTVGYVYSSDVSVKEESSSEETSEESKPSSSAHTQSSSTPASTSTSSGKAEVNWDATEESASTEETKPDEPNYEFFDPKNQ